MFRTATDFIGKYYLVNGKTTYTPEYLYENNRFLTPPNFYEVSSLD